MRALETGLVRVRWFAVAFGFFQVWQLGGTMPTPPDYVVPLSYVSIATLAVGNVMVSLATRRAGGLRSLRRIGAAAFALDAAVIFATIWIGSFDQNATGWTLAYVLPLEGALRYQLCGATASIVAFGVSESVREIYRQSLFSDLPFEVSSVTFRVGVFTIIALVAGMMAKGLERERLAAETRAEELERMARREADGRNEVQAFHDVVVAGLAGGTFADTMADIVEAMHRSLGYEAFAIRLIENNQLKLVGSYGFPEGSVGRSLPAGAGIVGRAISTGESQLVADTLADPDYVPWLSNAASEMVAPLTTANGQIIGVLDVESSTPAHFTAEDLDRLERLSSQIALVISSAKVLATERATVERLRELDTMKSDFVAITSHELRTPLTSIQGFIKTLRRSDVTLSRREMRDFLEIVERQAERLSRIVEGLLLTARIDAGTIDLRMDSAEVAAIVEETLAEVGPGRDRVQLAVDPNLPPIVTDGQRLGQILRNMIENAVKFSGEDAPIRVTIVREGSTLLVEVADRGPGIPEEDLPHAFDRFHQAGGSLRRVGQGLGLGLYIVRNLVEALNGSVEVRSTPGQGATFVVRLPLVAATPRAARA